MAILSQAAADVVQARIDALVDRRVVSPAERAYRALLGSLLADWEDRTVDMPYQESGVATITYLQQENGLSARALTPVFGSESVVAEVLSGGRRLQTEHIEALAEGFAVSPALFFPTAAPDCSPGPLEFLRGCDAT